MKPSLVLRPLALAALLGATLAAHAVDAFNNVDPAPNSYDGTLAWSIDASLSQGFLFTATASGTLSGFQVAMNNPPNNTNNLDFTLRLYNNGASDVLGGLLGSFAGKSTGTYYAATSGLASVDATASAVPIIVGSKYWLVASSPVQFFGLGWNRANLNVTKHVLISSSSTSYSNSDRSGAFSVQVNPVPEPATLAALGLATVALFRKRRK